MASRFEERDCPLCDLVEGESGDLDLISVVLIETSIDGHTRISHSTSSTAISSAGDSLIRAAL